MMQSSKNNGYSASDIRRYHADELSAADMQAMEKAALDDPFLADALEGYALTATPEKDLLSIRERMKEKKERTPIRAIWWQAAAVLLLITLGLWFFVRLDGSEKKSVARVEEDSIPPASTALAPQSYSTATPVLTDSTTSPVENRTVRVSKKPVVGNTAAPALAQTEAAVDTLHDNFFASAPAARVATNQNNGYTNIQDSVKKMDVVMTPLPGSEAKEIVMNRNQAAAKSRSVREFVIADTLEPTEGIARYNDYVASNLKQPDVPAGKPVGGAVRMSFDVDDSGSPVNIAVVKSDCPACDKEAIRLLSEGPKWKKKKNKKGMVTIRF